MQPNSSQRALLLRVDALAADGATAAAADLLRTALEAEPRFYPGWLRLSRLLFDAGNFPEAVKVTRQAERHDPLEREFRAIRSHMQARDFGRAEQLARRMLGAIPGHPRAAFTIAELARNRNYPEGGIRALRDCLEQAPANLFLRDLLIGLLEQAGEYQAAVDEARMLVSIEESFQTLWTRVRVLLRLGRNEELLRVCARARQHAAADPRKLGEVELVRGQVLRVMGRREESIAAYRACLAHDPMNAGAWWALADMKTFDFSDADSTALRRLVGTASLPPAQKSVALFALAKLSESLGDWDETMSLYRSANDMHPRRAFSPAAFAADVERRISALDAAALQRRAHPAPDGPVPVFILGLPRAGSTLVEQILASHSQIEGTIEQPTMASIARKAQLACASGHGGSLLDKAGLMSAAELSALGRAYLDDGALFRCAGTPFFTDKQPFNFRHIGLIHKLLPHARIIDVRRNPLDCGLSLYRQHFPVGVEFSYALEHIGAFYNGYLRLMDHWHTVLPGRVLTVHYEALVGEPEAAIREILAHVGVPFESACLAFHRTARAVRTASSEQVRQPINTRGIGAWRRVAAHLGPLRASLGVETLARFEGLCESAHPEPGPARAPARP